MANSEVLNDWQDDANSEVNTPADGAIMDLVSATGLPTELRRIKGVVRSLSLDAGWADYTGLIDAPGGGLSPVLGGSGTILVFQGNWSTIAQVGRRVRVSVSGGPPIVATIIQVDVGGATTSATLSRPIVGGTLTGVAFSQTGSALAGGQNAFPLDLEVATGAAPAGDNQTLVVPTIQGGTGRIDGALPLSGDLDGTTAGATVTRVQNFPFSNIQPTVGEVPVWDASAQWMYQALTSLVIFAGTAGASGSISYRISSTTLIILQWARGTPHTVASTNNVNANGTMDVTLPLDMVGGGGSFGLAMIENDAQGGAVASYLIVAHAVSFPDTHTARVAWRGINTNGNYTVTPTVFVVGTMPIP